MVTLDKRSDHKNPRASQDIVSRKAQLYQLQDDRQESVSQRKIQRVIGNSSIMVAQRQMINKIFGQVAQREPMLEEEPLQKKSADTVQREGKVEEEELVQPKFKDTARQGGDMAVQKKENNTGLPDNLKSGIENLSGVAMDDVKVHYGSDKPAQLNALAYAQGTDIHVAPGQEQHLPHEAWHVVQQKEGRVQPTMQMKDVAINDDAALEKEADTMGAKALHS